MMTNETHFDQVHADLPQKCPYLLSVFCVFHLSKDNAVPARLRCNFKPLFGGPQGARRVFRMVGTGAKRVNGDELLEDANR